MNKTNISISNLTWIIIWAYIIMEYRKPLHKFGYNILILEDHNNYVSPLENTTRLFWLLFF